jgi:nitroreductase
MMNETLNSIRNRRCIRAYKEEQIKDSELEEVLEAGKYAPSAVNQQSWHFTVIQNKEVLSRMELEIKAQFAKSSNPRFQQMASDEKLRVMYNAPTVILVSGDEKAIAPNADCAAAMENMMLAAESLNLATCWVNMTLGLFSGEKSAEWRSELGIPEGYKPFYSLTLGYNAQGEVEAAPRREGTVNYIR